MRRSVKNPTLCNPFYALHPPFGSYLFLTSSSLPVLQSRYISIYSHAVSIQLSIKWKLYIQRILSHNLFILDVRLRIYVREGGKGKKNWVENPAFGNIFLNPYLPST